MRIKKPFISEIANIVAKFGLIVSRKDLVGYCTEQNITIPAILYSHRASRGFFNLATLLKMAEDSKIHLETDVPPPPPEKTDAEIETDINARFASLDLMTYGVVDGSFRSLIVSGNPGIGKTYNLEKILEDAANASKILYKGVRGYVRATGLYRLMWEQRHKECVLMFDDADSVFQDELSLNLLKGGLDTTKRRHISWRSEKRFEAEDGEDIPQDFDFLGAIIFVSNINFPRLVAQGNKLAPHLEALMSRSFYLDLNLDNTRELIVRIKSVVAHSSILGGMTIKKDDQTRIVNFIAEYQDRLRELSLRTIVKMGIIWKASGNNFDRFSKMACSTLMRRGI
jgi:hypothetical protein